MGMQQGRPCREGRGPSAPAGPLCAAAGDARLAAPAPRLAAHGSCTPKPKEQRQASHRRTQTHSAPGRPATLTPARPPARRRPPTVAAEVALGLAGRRVGSVAVVQQADGVGHAGDNLPHGADACIHVCIGQLLVSVPLLRGGRRGGGRRGSARGQSAGGGGPARG